MWSRQATSSCTNSGWKWQVSQTEHKTQELCVHWTRNQLQNAFFKQGTLLLRGKPNSSEDPAMLCARWKLSATRHLASHTPSRLLGQARRELFCTGKRDTIQDLYANFASPSREGPRKLPGSVGCAHHNSSTPLKKSVWPSSATRTTRGTADSSSKTEHTAILAGCFPLTPEKIFLTCLGHSNDTRRG